MLTESLRLNNMRDILRNHAQTGLLHNVVQYSGVDKTSIEHWLAMPEMVPLQFEVDAIERALIRLHKEANGYSQLTFF